MPSIINNFSQSTTAPSETDFIPDNGALFYTQHPSSIQAKDTTAQPTVQKLKESNRRRLWCDPEDEFSAPIHTEHPLITKSPLEMSSFLLNYRPMHRSIEIMTPPVSQSSDETSSSATSSHIYPTIPDGPIYIHHRSTIAESPISNVISCPHINCYEHGRHFHSISRPGTPMCQKNKLLSSRQNDQDMKDDNYDTQDSSFHLTHGSPSSTSTSSLSLLSLSSPTPSILSSSSSSSSFSKNGSRGFSSSSPVKAQQEQSFLESHIASISQWLLSNSTNASA